ncbi:MAG: class I SAM-dependent methyltransferase [Bacteroidales bacterium]|nr:class I SAM-dependent methyltransferase [Bacteroidales bacterium]
MINSESLLPFRKSYFDQRLCYVFENITGKNLNILDIGCGYGTTAILLGMNGHHVRGTTLEYYFDQIEGRLGFWKNYGDTSTIHFVYENIFDSSYKPEEFDVIIAQDTLHHLEPNHKALEIIHSALKKNGKFIVIEENGNNVINNIKRFRERGFNRITEMYDEKLGKKIMFGNENTRSYEKWKNLFGKAGLEIDEKSVEFIRLFPPFFYNENNADHIIEREQKLWRKSKLLRNYFFLE